MTHPALGGLIADISGTTLSSEDKMILAHPQVGGIILFTRNYESQEQLSALCSAIRQVRETPLLIMVDQEGGRVQRFKDTFTRLPSLARLGQLFDTFPAKAETLIQNAGWLMAIELLSAGIDLSFAPVLDLNKGMSSVIGDRAFHQQPHIVGQLGHRYMQGMKEAGMAATGKHFPGHGSVQSDSHLALPIDERDLAVIMQDDLQPFKHLIQANIPALMAAHIVYPKIDSMPVSLSSHWLKNILRNQMHFKGVIFSDDLNMEGANVLPTVADRVLRAFDAGCDFALLCNNRAGVKAALEALEQRPHAVAADKWQSLQGDFTEAQKRPFQSHSRWLAANTLLTETL